MKFWLLCINSEFGDDYGAHIFKNKPSDEALKKWFKKNFRSAFDSDFEDGSGIFGSYLYTQWYKDKEVIDLI